MEVQGIDLAHIFMAAQARKDAEQQREMRQLAQDEHTLALQNEVKRQDAYSQLAQGGNDSALAKVAPQEALQYRAQQAEAQSKQQALARDEAQKRSDRTMLMQQNIAQALQNNPQMAGQYQQTINQYADAGQIDRFQIPGINLAPGLQGPEVAPSPEQIQGLQSQGGLLSKPQEIPFNDAAKNVLNETGGKLRPGMPGWDNAVKGERARLEQLAMQEKLVGQNNVNAGDLRKEFQSQQVYKDTQILASAYNKILKSSTTGAGDMGLIFGYMKMLDPNSTVREGEYATAETAGSVPGRIMTVYNKVLKGEKLAPELRSQFRTEAGSIFGAQKQRYDSMASQYSRLASQSGIPTQDVILDPGFSGMGGQAPAPTGVDAKKLLLKARAAGELTENQYNAALKNLEAQNAGR